MSLGLPTCISAYSNNILIFIPSGWSRLPPHVPPAYVWVLTAVSCSSRQVSSPFCLIPCHWACLVGTFWAACTQWKYSHLSVALLHARKVPCPHFKGKKKLRFKKCPAVYPQNLRQHANAWVQPTPLLTLNTLYLFYLMMQCIWVGPGTPLFPGPGLPCYGAITSWLACCLSWQLCEPCLLTRRSLSMAERQQPQIQA